MPGKPLYIQQHTTIASATQNAATRILTAPDDACIQLSAVGYYASTYATGSVYLQMCLLPPHVGDNVVLGANTGVYFCSQGQASVNADGPESGNTLFPFTKWFSSGGTLTIPPAWSLAVYFNNGDPAANVYEIYAVGLPVKKDYR